NAHYRIIYDVGNAGAPGETMPARRTTTMRYPPGPRDDWAGWDSASTQPIAPAPPRTPYPVPQPSRRPPVAPPASWPNVAGKPPGHPFNWGRVARIVFVVAMLVVLILTGLTLHRIADFGQAISTQGPFSTQTGFMSGSDRVNVVVLGY